ncbi:hypothetical protein HY2_05735 [Hyphomonas pacifica]|nr:hypothetical protein HY2_05735 [Hyphomonas pacifica]
MGLMTGTMYLNAPPPENDVVRLENLSETHRSDLQDSSVAASMWEWMPVIPTGTSLDAYIDYCLAEMRGDSFYPFVVYRKSDNSFAGLVAYERVSRTHRRLGVGFLWHPEHVRGTDVVPATQLALLERAVQARFQRISYYIPEENERALRAFDRIGARREGVIRHYMRAANGTWSNVVVLSLITDEIKAAMDVLGDRVRQLQLA